VKILIGISYYFPNISGVTIYAKRLAEGLVKRGHEVTVLTSRYDQSLPQKEIINGVLVFRSKVLLKIGKGILMPLLPLQIFKLVKGCEIINCHLPQFESFVFAIIGKLIGKRVILTHHTDLSGWPGFFNRIAEGSVWGGQLIAGMLADKIVPYTKDYADHSWYLRLFRRKLTYILPPIIAGRPDKNLAKKWQKELNNPQYIIGFAGRIARQKGIPYLLRAIPFLEKEFASFKIVFAGPYKKVIGENYFLEIENLVNKYKERLFFLGDISEEKMATFYSICDVLVLPSDDRLESFGLVQAESMLQGCPVVATDLPGARMPIKLTGMGLVVPAKNSQLLAEAIVKITKKRNFFVQTKNKAKKIFDCQKTIEEYERLFNQS